MFNKSTNIIRRLNRENFYFSSQSFQIWWQISGLKVWKNAKFQLNISKLWQLGQKNTISESNNKCLNSRYITY